MTNDSPDRLSSSDVQEVEDVALDSWDEWLATQDPAFRRTIPPREPEDPFQVAIAPPRAIDIHRLYRILEREIPAEIAAVLGSTVPLLLCYGMTPFYRPGRAPTGIWGMGFEARFAQRSVLPVSLHPDSRKYDVLQASQSVTVGLDLGGAIGIPDGHVQALEQIPGLSITGATVKGSTHQTYGLLLECTLSILEIQAGPNEQGGARWNLYRGRESIDTYQPFFQTILVPRGTRSLKVKVDTWIRRSGRFFGLLKARHWTYPSLQFDVSLEGLEC